MNRIAVTAFSGWNDAGDASTGVISHLLEVWPSRRVGVVDSEEYIDFQVNRPVIRTDDDGRRVIDWPDTELRLVEPPSGPQIITVVGPEPSLRWKSYCDELVDLLQDLGATEMISLGALLADVPHTRPLPVSDRRELPAGDTVPGEDLYEGPIGVPTVLVRSSASIGMRTRSLWVQVPHYVSQGPNPKATLALIEQMQQHLETPIPVEDLMEAAAAWERGVDELARTDQDVAAYVRRLEQAKDATDLPEATGDAIAQQFEQFLRRRDDR